jgi:hypothetical protein
MPGIVGHLVLRGESRIETQIGPSEVRNQAAQVKQYAMDKGFLTGTRQSPIHVVDGLSPTCPCKIFQDCCGGNTMVLQGQSYVCSVKSCKPAHWRRPLSTLCQHSTSCSVLIPQVAVGCQCPGRHSQPGELTPSLLRAQFKCFCFHRNMSACYRVRPTLAWALCDSDRP